MDAHLDAQRFLAPDLGEDECAHLAGCPRCARTASELRDVVARYRADERHPYLPSAARGWRDPLVLWALLEETWLEWREDRATAQGAALAFYSLFAAAPMVVLATAILGWILGFDDAQRQLSAELDALLTPEVAGAIAVLVDDAHARDSGLAVSGFGLLVAVYGSLRGFAALQSALNMLWGVRAVRGPGLFELLRRKLLAFASIASCGVLLLVSIGLTIVVHWVAARASEEYVPQPWLVRAGEELSTLLLAALLLTIVFKTLPDVRIRWRDVLVGALVSAVLFLAGKHAVAYYLRHVEVASGFGAASAVVAVLLYVQYIAQVLLFGAEFTFVFARWGGQPIRPGPGAARVVRTTIHDDEERP